jgi:hypothetical protein
MLGCAVSWPIVLAIIWSTLMPECSTAPFAICAPESRLPVCAG